MTQAYLPLRSNTPEYQRIHARVKREKGNAQQYRCIWKCGRTAHDWAWLHHLDPRDWQSYRPMCGKCHRVYDRKEFPIGSAYDET